MLSDLDQVWALRKGVFTWIFLAAQKMYVSYSYGGYDLAKWCFDLKQGQMYDEIKKQNHARLFGYWIISASSFWLSSFTPVDSVIRRASF
jgi:hypothetical protein